MSIQILPRPHLLSVLRRADGDCSNNGVTAKFSSLSVIAVTDDERGLRSYAHKKGEAEQAIRDRLTNHDAMIGGTGLVLVHREAGDCLVPVSLVLAGKWWMKGGNYVSSTDARWQEIADLPLPVFDRVES